MNTNNILSADLLDLIFDDRNKAYGAYELRKTYHTRIKKALLITAGVAALIFAGTVLAGSLRPAHEATYVIKDLQLSDVPKEKEPEPLPPPKKQPEPEPVKVVHLATVKLVDNPDEPPPTQADATEAKIDFFTQEGVIDNHIPELSDATGKGIIEQSKNATDDQPHTIVQVQARFAGNWERFLTKNLRPETPVDKGAPVGRYKVIIQFVVDVDGSVSDIRPMTSMGFGLEEEAMRVIRKSDKWEAAIQNGYKVKAYRQQPIIFEVAGE